MIALHGLFNSLVKDWHFLQMLLLYGTAKHMTARCQAY